MEEHVGACPGCQQLLQRLVGTLPGPMSPLTEPQGGAADEEPPALPGYALAGRIDVGGMGVVWRARDLEFGRPLAVKVMKASACDNPRSVRRFLAEARITGQLAHPSVVPVHAMGRLPDGRPYYTMKLVEGQTLAALLSGRPGPASRQAEMVRVFAQVCQAVAYAHARGVVHRDLKPSNVMVGAFGEVQVMDWGLAKVLAGDDGAEDGPSSSHGVAEKPSGRAGRRAGEPDSDTEPGAVIGTLPYMPPEQARGEAEGADPRCDVFGLGAILCEILTGEPPYRGASRDLLYRQATEGDLGDALARLDGCGADAELVRLAKACLSAGPARRPAAAAEVAEAVAAYQAGVQERLRRAELERAAAAVRAAEERKRRRLTAALAAALAGLLALGGGGGLWLRHQQDVLERQQEAQRQDEVRQEQAVEEALGQTRSLQEQARWPEARAVLTQASSRLARSRREDLRRRLGQAESELALVERLDAIRLNRVTLIGGRADFEATARAYAAAFAGEGVPGPDEALPAVASRIRGSAVREPLVTALDDWALVTADDALRARLLRLAREADPHPWRDRVRDPDAWLDRGTLEELAAAPAGAQPPQVLAGLAARLRRAGGDPVPVLRAAQRLHPDDFWINYYLGWALTARSSPADAAEAVGYFRAALVRRPRSAVVQNELGRALHGKGDLDGALDAYRRGIDLDPTAAHLHVNLGNALKRKGKLDDAAAAYREAIDLAPDLALAHYNLGVVLTEKKAPGAIDAFRRALVADPRLVQAYNNLGNALRDGGDRDGAVEVFRRGVCVAPDHKTTLVNLGEALREKGDVAGALTVLRHAVAVHPNFSDAHHNLGNALRDAGDVPGAVAGFRRAVVLDADHAEAHFNLGLLLWEQGQFAEALPYLKRGHQLGSRQPGWRADSAQWVERCEREVALRRPSKEEP